MDSQIETRLGLIEQRLTDIENHIGISLSPGVIKHVSPPTHPVTNASSIAEPQLPLYPEDHKPVNWLGICAIICFVAAAGFIIKLSIDSGWLTPARQVGIATLFGFSLIAAGFMLMRIDRSYASLLPGAGTIVLYVTVFAAHRYHALIPIELALFLSGMVSALCICLYTLIRIDLYPVTAAVGAYAAPAILGFDTTATFSIYYFIICSLAFATISVWMRSRILTLVSAYLAILMCGLAGAEMNQDALVAGALVFTFLVFSLGTYFYTTHNNAPLTEAESWCFLPVLLIFYAMEYYFIDRIHYGLAPWFSLGFAALLIGLYMLAKPWAGEGALNSKPLLIIFTTIVCFHSLYLELLPDAFRPWLFVIIVVGSVFFPATILPNASRAFFVPVIAVLAILAIEYLTMIFTLLADTPCDMSWVVVSIASLISLWFLLVAVDSGAPVRDKYGYVLLGAAHILAISAFYRLTEDISSLAISASWLMYAVCVMVFAFLRRDGTMAKSALIVLAIAAGKALLYDAAEAATVVRILCLLLTGAVLYGAGFLMRKISSWS